jgi:rSAM/selenodomain-associated transferase 1
MNNIVALMAKYPELGKVKTRLAKSLGDDTALNIYLGLLSNAIESCNPIENNNYSFGVFVTPSDKLENFKSMITDLDFYRSQSDGDLGYRMKNVIEFLFAEYNSTKAILIGADIPNLDRAIITKAFDSLDVCDTVFGPTEDGGYYLIGMSKLHKELFENIKWGQDDVLLSSLDIADANNISYHLLESLQDLDTEEDLESFPELYKKYRNKKTGI